MKRFARVAAVVTVAGAALACGAAFIAPDVTPQLVEIAQGQQAGITQDDLQRGHDTFVASCGRGGFCHKLPTPKSRSAERWPGILDQMAVKANLHAGQKQDVLRFILAVRELPAETPAK